MAEDPSETLEPPPKTSVEDPGAHDLGEATYLLITMKLHLTDQDYKSQSQTHLIPMTNFKTLNLRQHLLREESLLLSPTPESRKSMTSPAMEKSPALRHIVYESMMLHLTR